MTLSYLMSILKPLFFGIIAALLALVFEIIFSFIPGFNFKTLFQQLSWILIILILIEESIKILFVWKNFSAFAKILSKYQMFCQSLLVGLGFAITEIIIFLPEKSGELRYLILYLGVFAVHIGTTGLIGYFLIKSEKVNFWTFLRILPIAFGCHFIFNLFSIYIASSWIIAIFIFILAFFVVLAGFRISISQKTYTQTEDLQNKI